MIRITCEKRRRGALRAGAVAGRIQRRRALEIAIEFREQALALGAPFGGDLRAKALVLREVSVRPGGAHARGSEIGAVDRGLLRHGEKIGQRGSLQPEIPVLADLEALVEPATGEDLAPEQHRVVRKVAVLEQQQPRVRLCAHRHDPALGDLARLCVRQRVPVVRLERGGEAGDVPRRDEIIVVEEPEVPPGSGREPGVGRDGP